ncbi:hypothetical protein [Eisenbergiella sp.]|nr:hypothetical protein [Eisenbergiella sp.]BDF47872.1 hypothetical protein CE91St56_49950 [Lachnospiraceae bacterium]GKH43947.1 hypothetical protein CE91St57_49210 [Lachnospiraceae bacterium]
MGKSGKKRYDDSKKNIEILIERSKGDTGTGYKIQLYFSQIISDQHE